MTYEDFRRRARIVEEAFAKHLTDPVWATSQQDFQEHWDVRGKLCDVDLKFDVKGMKKKNRYDQSVQDECAWVEGTNVRGKPGWLKGQADYIVFERQDCWLVVKRENLKTFVFEKLKDKGYEEGKGPYLVYQRAGRQDRITMIPFVDIEKIKETFKIDKK